MFQGAVAPRPADRAIEENDRLARENSTLRDQVADLKGEIKKAEMLAVDLRADIRDEEGRNAALKDRIREMTARAQVFEDLTDMLAKSHTLVKAGDIEEALYQIAYVLDHLDSAWRVRA